MNKYKEISYNTIIFTIGNVSIKLIQFFLLPLLTLRLSTTDYNTADLLASALELLMPLLMLGLADAVFRFALDCGQDKGSVFVSSFVVALIGIAVVAISMFAVNAAYPQNFWHLFSFLYAVTVLNTLISSYVKGIERIKTFAFSGIAQALTLALFCFVAVYRMDLGLTGYLWALILSNILRIVLLMIFGKVVGGLSHGKFRPRLLKAMVIYALPLIPNNISWWLVHVAGKYICTIFLGGQIAGIFAASAKLPSVINMIAAIFLQSWTISAAKTVGDSDKGTFNSVVFRYYSALIMCSASAVYVVLPFISRFLLKGDFFQGWTYSAPLILSAALTCYSSYFGAFYGANFKTKMVFVSTLCGAALNVALSLAFIRLIGVYALLLASVVSYAVIVVIRAADTQKFSDIKINYPKELIGFSLLTAQAAAITFASGVYWVQPLFFVAALLLRLKDISAALKKVKTVAGMRKNI